MKIRIAINTDFVSRKIRGAAYGILLLLTFFVPQFAKTQDQLNAAKAAQAALKNGVAIEQNHQNHAAPPIGKFPETASAANAPLRETAVFTESSVGIKPVEVKELRQYDAPVVMTPMTPMTQTAQPALIASLASVVLPPAPVQEIAVFSEAPVEVTREVVEIRQQAEPAMTRAAQTAQPVLAASLSPVVLPSAPAQEIVGFTEPPAAAGRTSIEIRRQTAPVAAQTTQPVLTASLYPAVLPAQSASGQSPRFTGERITLDAVNVPLVDFFRMMQKVSGLNIMLDPAITGNISSITVEMMPWDELFEAVLKNHGLDKEIDGTTIRVARKATLQEEANQREALKKASMMAGDLDHKVKRLNYAKATELKSLLVDMKTARGTVVVDERTNSLILTDLPDSIEKQVRLIETLDIPQPQVEIETRIVSSTRNFARDLGVQFGFVQGNSQRITVGGGNPAYLQPSGGGTANRPMGETSSSSDSPGVSVGPSDTGGNLNVNLPARAPYGGMGIAIGNILDTFLLDAAITAGESKGTAKLISQPKVVVQNNSKAVVNNGIRFPVTVNQDNTITIQFFDAALTLTATPQITYDGNILLDLNLTNNKADFSNLSVTGVPSIRTSETNTRVLVSDGGTTVLAGIFVEDDSKNEEKIPGLGSLPILGNLFRRTGTVRDTQDILFIVTPRILK